MKKPGRPAREWTLKERERPTRRFWLILGFTMILPLASGLLLLVGMLFLVAGKPPLVLIEAETGFLSFRVQREALSVMALDGAEVREIASFCPAGLDEAGKVRAIVRPAFGTTVEYHWLPGMVMIRFLSENGDPALVESAGGEQCRAAEANLTFLVPAEALQRVPPLPVLGRGQIGAELGVPTLPGLPSACRDIALAGHRCVDNGLHEIPVTATTDRTLHRATAKLFGRTSAPFSGGQLYPITSDEIPIPGGSRLETNNEDTPFIGSVGLSGDGMSLLTQVTVEADSLRVYRVGRTEQAEVLATGAIARAIGDPSLWPLLILTAIIAYLLQLAINLRGIFKDAAGEK